MNKLGFHFSITEEEYVGKLSCFCIEFINEDFTACLNRIKEWSFSAYAWKQKKVTEFYFTTL